ncbi:hypothetical protein CTEN210_12088 [Chaetoceros tenuissimus]|uniref:DUF4149 domain-containing protein n=1 Tax=Chaetoceros tenuissimus TaxID=426638 RepID=A0AAD3D0Z0_9STRA|nr:hypothetical protein CTEN210_12088 [Chaetoceros tenuissimus]
MYFLKKLILLSAISYSTAFLPSSNIPSTRINGPLSRDSITHPSTYALQKPTRFQKSTMQLASSPDTQLTVGFVTIVAACTPYVLGVIFPKFFNKSFFLPVYEEDDAGRVAEIGWKVRYASLGLALTTLLFLEVYVNPTKDITSVLKDSYITWAIFYAEATRKIRSEATSEPPVFSGNRLGVQLWHVLVTIVLWADVSESFTGNFIETSLVKLFT